MAKLSEALFDDLLELLGDHDLADRLRSEQADNRSNFTNRNVTIEIPEQLLPHLHGCFAVGATTSKMCHESGFSVKMQSEFSEACRSQIPPTLKAVILHQSDISTIYDILAQNGSFELRTTAWSKDFDDLIFTAPGRTRPFSPMISRAGVEILKEKSSVTALEDELSALHERLKSPPEPEPEEPYMDP